jgi:hypothetical protein
LSASARHRPGSSGSSASPLTQGPCADCASLRELRRGDKGSSVQEGGLSAPAIATVILYPERNRWFADSPLEGDGFEPSVPRGSATGFRHYPANRLGTFQCCGRELGLSWSYARPTWHAQIAVVRVCRAVQIRVGLPKLGAPGDALGRQTTSSQLHSASLVQPSRIRYLASSADISRVPSGPMLRCRPERVCADPMWGARRRTRRLVRCWSCSACRR